MLNVEEIVGIRTANVYRHFVGVIAIDDQWLWVWVIVGDDSLQLLADQDWAFSPCAAF